MISCLGRERAGYAENKICQLTSGTKNSIITLMNTKHQRTLEAIFTTPVLSNILWSDIVTLLQSLGASISEGRGSRIRIELNGNDAVFHRPHPQKETDKGAVASMRRFLETAGVQP